MASVRLNNIKMTKGTEVKTGMATARIAITITDSRGVIMHHMIATITITNKEGKKTTKGLEIIKLTGDNK